MARSRVGVSAAMQLAALVAVVAYVRSDILEIVTGSIGALRRRDFANGDLRLAIGIALGTVPIGIAGPLLASKLNACNSPLRGLSVIGVSCIVMGLLVMLADRVGHHRRRFADMRLANAPIVGLAQIGALIPGCPARDRR